MKKIKCYSIVLLTALLFPLLSCSSDDGSNVTDTNLVVAGQISYSAEECSVEGQNDFVYRLMTDTYLWYDEVPSVDPANFDSPEELLDRFYYEVYPLLGEAGKQIGIIGAGDAAFDYALNLAKYNKVIILNRGTVVSCLPLLWERAELEDNIDYHQQISVDRVSPGPDGRIMLECNKSKVFIADYLITAIGRDPNLDFVSGQFSEKTIQLENSGKLYFVGDVANGLYRQTAIAVGDGILAAMKIYKYLKEKD